MINLLPISQVVKATQVDKIHLAYLTKLRLLPQTIRRKINNKIEGCYPDSVIPLVKRVEDLKRRGLTYSQIKFHLEPGEVSSLPAFSPATNNNSLLFLIIGILLGYLLAARPVVTSQAAAASISSLNVDSKTMLQVLAKSPQEPIYMIAVPRQNFYRLGQISINELTEND